MASTRRKGAPRRSAAKAYDKAKELGLLVPVEPAERRVDGSPRAGSGQAYAMKAGEVFHPAWCSAVADKWDNNPSGLLVVEASAVGLRRQCRLCDEPLGD